MKTISIGRAPDNDLVLNESNVSRYHARMYYKSGNWYIVDLQSTHGTTVNGTKVEGPFKIRPSDKIKLSETKIVYDGDNLLSANGEILFTVVSISSSSKKVPTKDGSTGNRVKILAFGGLTSIIFLLGAVFLLFNASNTEPVTEIRQERNIEPATYQGTIAHNDGTYTGEIYNGVPHGFGTIEYSPTFRQDYSADGLPHLRTIGVISYTGQWSHGLKDGRGKKVFANGSVVEGYWEKGEYLGP